MNTKLQEWSLCKHYIHVTVIGPDFCCVPRQLCDDERFSPRFQTFVGDLEFEDIIQFHMVQNCLNKPFHWKNIDMTLMCCTCETYFPNLGRINNTLLKCYK